MVAAAVSDMARNQYKSDLCELQLYCSNPSQQNYSAEEDLSKSPERQHCDQCRAGKPAKSLWKPAQYGKLPCPGTLIRNAATNVLAYRSELFLV